MYPGSPLGELFTWGDEVGADQSNGNLLGHGDIDMAPDSHPTKPPRRVEALAYHPVAEVSLYRERDEYIDIDIYIYIYVSMYI